MKPALTAEGLAATHALAFEQNGWPVADFSAYLTDPKVLVFGTDRCFAVFRVLPPEAEVLTLATHPAEQGYGHATAMLRGVLAHLDQIGIVAVFLDVAAQNAAALALYTRAGFVAFDERRKYYPDGSTAICMKLGL